MAYSLRGYARALLSVAALATAGAAIVKPFKQGGWLDRNLLHDGSAAPSWEEMYKIDVKRMPVWEKTEDADQTVRDELSYRLPTDYYSYQQQHPTFDQRKALFDVTSDYTIKVETRAADLLKTSGVTHCPESSTIQNYPRLTSKFDEPEPAKIKQELDSNNQLIGRLFVALDAEEKAMQCIVWQNSSDERYESFRFRRAGRNTILRNTALLEKTGAEAQRDAAEYQTAVRKLGITLGTDSFSGRQPELTRLTGGN